MKKIKKMIMGVLLMSITASELTACIPNRQKNEEQAVRLLEEKYEEEFGIEEYRGRQNMYEYYEVVAYSHKYPEILFEAEIACDGSSSVDEYVASRVCCAAGEQIESNLGMLPGYLQIKVQAVAKSIDSADADMSMQEFMSIKTKNRFAVYIVYYPAEQDVNRAYQALTGAFAGLACMSGNIQLYVVNEKTLHHVQEYLANHAKVDYEFDEALEHIEPMVVPFEYGEIQLSLEAFREMAGDRL